MDFKEKNQNDETLYKLFLELQNEKKIIDKKIKLVETKFTPNFQGLNFFSLFKRIRFNPVFFRECHSKYGDNVIRFILLHESGHISTGSWLRNENILASAAIVAIIINIFTFFFADRFFGFIIGMSALVVIVLFIRFLIKFTLNSMKNDEFTADEYALKKMKEHYNISNPCSLIDECFNALQSIQNDPSYNEKQKMNLFLVIVVKLIGLSEGYHPTIEERIKWLKEIEKCEK